MPAGVSSARHFVTGGAVPPACWCKSRQRASRVPASMLARGLPIRCLLDWRYAPTVICSGSFLPPKFCGGQKWPVGFERKAASPRGCFSPFRPPVGDTGELKEKGIAGLLDQSPRLVVSGHQSASSPPCPMPPLPHRLPCPPTRDDPTPHNAASDR